MMRLSFAFFLLLLAPLVRAAVPEYSIRIKDHLFFPAELEVPAGTKVRLLVINEDATPEEFESYELNREKVIPGGTRAVIFVGPLKPGAYPFFGEFYPKTAQGRIIAK
ncbi:MAG: cupredoxin domain-containing protein [Pseudohongiellaceae bacterium]